MFRLACCGCQTLTVVWQMLRFRDSCAAERSTLYHGPRQGRKAKPVLEDLEEPELEMLYVGGFPGKVAGSSAVQCLMAASASIIECIPTTVLANTTVGQYPAVDVVTFIEDREGDGMQTPLHGWCSLLCMWCHSVMGILQDMLLSILMRMFLCAVQTVARPLSP